MATVDLYRAVSHDELADVRRTGQLRASASSCEGKHLATTLADARRWGDALYRGGPFAVVRVTVDEAAVRHFDRWERLDAIGPAFFATIESLRNAAVHEVIDEE